MYTDFRTEWLLRQELAKQIFLEANASQAHGNSKVSQWVKALRDKAHRSDALHHAEPCGC